MIAFTNPSGAVPDLVAALLEQTAADVLGADLLARLEGHAAALPNQADRARLFARLAILASAGYSDLAARLTNRALNSAERVDDPEECVHTLAAVALLFRRGGRAAGAEEACERAAVLAAALPAGEGRTRAFLAVAAAVARVSSTARGLAIAGSVADAGAIPRNGAAANGTNGAAHGSRLDASDLAEADETVDADDIGSVDEFEAVAETETTDVPETNGHAEAQNGDASQAAPVYHPSRRRRRRH